MSYTSIANISAYLQLVLDGSSTPSDATVTEWIEEVDDEIERITKQKFELNTVTDEIVSFSSDTGTASANNFDATGVYNLPAPQDEIRLKNTKIIALTSVEYNQAGDNETPDWVALEIGYGKDVILVGDRISVIGTDFVLRKQKVSLKVSYTYGDSTVPKFIQKVATRMVALQYASSGLANEVTSGGGSIRVGDIEIDEPGQFSQKYINDTEEWVEMKLNQIGTHNVYVI